MFGNNILVAPIIEEKDSRDVYLPGQDRWVDYQTGEIYNPGWNHIECGELPIIMLVKDGSAIPHVAVAERTDQIDWNNITWKKYLANKTQAEGLLCLPTDNALQSISFQLNKVSLTESALEAVVSRALLLYR